MTTTKTYAISTTHAASSHGQAVLLDADGVPHGFDDLGIADLASNFCGRVDYRDASGDWRVEWSGYGEQPFRMWSALQRAIAANRRLTTVEVRDSGRFVCN